jgi:hypothetical protein
VAAVSDTPSVVSRAVNVLKGKVNNTGAQAQAIPSWDDDSLFDQEKEKEGFRQYDGACDRVKEFYREQHGMRPSRQSRLHFLLSHWFDDEQRNKPSRTISAFARNSSEPSEPAWVFGKPWRSLASLSTIQILMWVFPDFPHRVVILFAALSAGPFFATPLLNSARGPSRLWAPASYFFLSLLFPEAPLRRIGELDS